MKHENKLMKFEEILLKMPKRQPEKWSEWRYECQTCPVAKRIKVKLDAI